MNRFAILLLSLMLTVLMSYASYAAITEGSGDIVISDIKSWKHPTKKIFQKYKVPVRKVVLKENGKYPVFFVELPYDPLSSQNDRFYNKLYLELLKANGWWNYSLDDEADNLVISIKWDKKGRTMHTDFEQKQ